MTVKTSRVEVACKLCSTLSVYMRAKYRKVGCFRLNFTLKTQETQTYLKTLRRVVKCVFFLAQVDELSWWGLRFLTCVLVYKEVGFFLLLTSSDEPAAPTDQRGGLWRVTCWDWLCKWQSAVTHPIHCEQLHENQPGTSGNIQDKWNVEIEIVHFVKCFNTFCCVFKRCFWVLKHTAVSEKWWLCELLCFS